MLVYVVTNKANGMRYVGATRRKDEAKRMDEHIKASRGKTSPKSLQEAIAEYGEKNFSIHVVERCASLKELSEAEKTWISQLNTQTPDGYNIARGGIPTKPIWHYSNCSKVHEVEGKKFYSIEALAEEYGASPHNLRWRLIRSPEPWTIRQALGLDEPPTLDPLRNFKNTEVDGKKFKSQAAACKHYGVEVKLYRTRLQHGWTPEEALGVHERVSPFTDPNAKAVEVEGKKFRSLKQAAEHYGLRYFTVWQRVSVNGWTLEEALLLKPRKTNYQPPRKLAGYPTITAAAKAHGIKQQTLSRRLQAGWTVEQALGVTPRLGNNQSTRA